MRREDVGNTNRDQSAQILVDKINLLLDTLCTDAGESFDFTTIQQDLKDRGVAISRAKWHYLKTADTRVRPDEKLLQALGEVLGVDPSHLVQEDGPLPQQSRAETSYGAPTDGSRSANSQPWPSAKSTRRDSKQSSTSSRRTKRPRCTTQLIGVE